MPAIGFPPLANAIGTPQVRMTYGQSWASNEEGTFSGLNLDPGGSGLVALHTPSIGNPTFLPGPLPNGSGVWLTGTPDGYTSYGSLDTVTVGRCATLAHQLLRKARGYPNVPEVEFCAAYPGSDWLTGGGGGLQPGGTSWTNMLTIIAAIKALPQAVSFRSVDYLQGGATPDTAAQKLSDLTAMLQDFDALELSGTNIQALKYYIGIAAATSNSTSYDPSELATATLCQSNAPGGGGPFDGRAVLTTPWYQLPFDGTDNIHLGAYGTARVGEMHGLVRLYCEDEGIPWTPLWWSPSNPITVSGQTITIPFSRPWSPDFGSGTLSFAAGDDPAGSFSMLPQYGFDLRRSGSEITLSNFTILPAAPNSAIVNVQMTAATPPDAGDEFSYANYGPGTPGTNGPHSGVWGNLVMRGPASVLFPGSTIDAWAVPFDTTLTVP
jgi:hypothetical protein